MLYVSFHSVFLGVPGGGLFKASSSVSITFFLQGGRTGAERGAIFYRFLLFFMMILFSAVRGSLITLIAEKDGLS